MHSTHLLDHEYIELLEGILETSDCERVLEHLESCKRCELEFGALVAQRERARGSVPPTALPVPRARRRWPFALSVAAAAALAAIVLSPLRSSGPAVPTLPALKAELVHRGIPAEYPGVEAGIEAYARGAFEEAVRLLEPSVDANEWELRRRIYLGSSLAQLERWSEAVEVLEPVDYDLLPDPWRETSLQTFAKSLCASGLYDRMQTLLSEIERDPGNLADRIREELDCR